MSPRRIPGQPMKYWGFHCPGELKLKTQEIAYNLNESDSEYIRKAVEQRNQRETYLEFNAQSFEAGEKIKRYDIVTIKDDDKAYKTDKPTHTIVPGGKPTMVQSFGKGGK